MLSLAGVTGAARSWAADANTAPPPAPATVSPGGPGVKTAPAGPSAPAAPSTPAPAPAPAPPYSYQPTGKADPFVPFIELELALKKKQEEDRKLKAAGTKKMPVPVSPLQQAEIGQLRLIGIAGNDQKRTAIVEDGVAKKYYPLSVGTHIGPNGGRVVSILPDRVIVEERFQDETTKTKKPTIRRIPMMLHKEEEGKP